MSITLEENHPKSGTSGYISWERLANLMKTAGEVRPNEKITRVEVNSDGVRYFVTKQGNDNGRI